MNMSDASESEEHLNPFSTDDTLLGDELFEDVQHNIMHVVQKKRLLYRICRHNHPSIKS